MRRWDVKEPDLPGMILRIERGESLSYARYADGEWNCVLRRNLGGMGCEHHFTPSLANDLGRALASRPSYSVASIGPDERGYPTHEIGDWLHAHGMLDFPFESVEVFGNALIEAGQAGEVFPLIPLAKNRIGFKTFVMIGPFRYRAYKMSSMFGGFDRFIELPDIDCHPLRDHVVRCLREIRDTLPMPALCYVSAAMSTESVIHEAFPYVGDRISMWDVGSVWEPYCGLSTRSWHDRIGTLLREPKKADGCKVEVIPYKP